MTGSHAMPIAQQIPVSNGGFDPRVFLARPEAGKTIERYSKNQKIFSQGDVADNVFFIQRGKVKITVLSELGKEAVVGILDRKSTRLNSSHSQISYAVFCLKKKNICIVRQLH